MRLLLLPVLLLTAVHSLFADFFPAPPFAVSPSLLEREISGGFVPEGAVWAKKVIIYENGLVELARKQNANDRWSYVPLATLDSRIKRDLINLVSSIVAGELTFPDDPACVDAPETTYTAYKRGQPGIVFAKEVGCNMGYLESFNDGLQLQRILDGLSWFDIE